MIQEHQSIELLLLLLNVLDVVVPRALKKRHRNVAKNQLCRLRIVAVTVNLRIIRQDVKREAVELSVASLSRTQMRNQSYKKDLQHALCALQKSFKNQHHQVRNDSAKTTVFKTGTR